jgi:hypothetical protein
MSDPIQSSGDPDELLQTTNDVTDGGINGAVRSGDRLMDFLDAYCGLDSEAQDTAEMLHSDRGIYYRDWLPKELGEALLLGRITPQLMSERWGMHFDNQDKLNEFFRNRWLLWFPESPFPLDGKTGE